MREKKNNYLRKTNIERIRKVKIDTNSNLDQFTNFLSNSNFYNRINDDKKKSNTK